jgi:hypothetical protein
MLLDRCHVYAFKPQPHDRQRSKNEVTRADKWPDAPVRTDRTRTWCLVNARLCCWAPWPDAPAYAPDAPQCGVRSSTESYLRGFLSIGRVRSQLTGRATASVHPRALRCSTGCWRHTDRTRRCSPCLCTWDELTGRDPSVRSARPRRLVAQKIALPLPEKRRIPSLPLKLHLLHKCANTTKCTSPCTYVLTFSAVILKKLG